MLFQVALVKKPTKKQAEEGAQEELVMPPTAVLAADEKGAAIRAVTQAKVAMEDLASVEVLVRPF